MPLSTAHPIKPFLLPLLLTLLFLSFLCVQVRLLLGHPKLGDKAQPLAWHCKGLGALLRARESSVPPQTSSWAPTNTWICTRIAVVISLSLRWQRVPYPLYWTLLQFIEGSISTTEFRHCFSLIEHQFYLGVSCLLCTEETLLGKVFSFVAEVGWWAGACCVCCFSWPHSTFCICQQKVPFKRTKVHSGFVQLFFFLL